MGCRGACNFYVRGGQTKKPEQLQKATRKDSHSEFRIYHCVHGPEDDSVPCVFGLPSFCSRSSAATALQRRGRVILHCNCTYIDIAARLPTGACATAVLCRGSRCLKFRPELSVATWNSTVLRALLPLTAP